MAFRFYLEEQLNETTLNYILTNPSSILKSLEIQYVECELNIQKAKMKKGKKELEKYYSIEKEMVGRFIRSIKEWELYKK